MVDRPERLALERLARDSLVDGATVDRYYVGDFETLFLEAGPRAAVYEVEEGDGGSWPPFRYGTRDAQQRCPECNGPERHHVGCSRKVAVVPVTWADVLPNLNEGPLR